jgi:hypothetical protein
MKSLHVDPDGSSVLPELGLSAEQQQACGAPILRRVCHCDLA